MWKSTVTNCVLCCVTQGNGIIVGLGICGVVFAATSSAATLMGDFRTGYICLAAPRAMFVAQLVGQMMGAILAPLAFEVFYLTEQVSMTTDCVVSYGGDPAGCGVWAPLFDGQAACIVVDTSAASIYVVVIHLLQS